MQIQEGLTFGKKIIIYLILFIVPFLNPTLHSYKLEIFYIYSNIYWIIKKKTQDPVKYIFYTMPELLKNYVNYGF